MSQFTDFKSHVQMWDCSIVVYDIWLCFNQKQFVHDCCYH